MSSGRTGSPTPSSSGRSKPAKMVVTAKEVKVPMPDTFDSARDKLKKFILQVELYMSFQLSKFIRDSQRVL